MKNLQLLYVLVFAFMATCGHAQMEKGKILIGTSTSLGLTNGSSGLFDLGFSTMKYKSDAAGFEEEDPDKATTINLTPRVGYFYHSEFGRWLGPDNWIFGIQRWN